MLEMWTFKKYSGDAIIKYTPSPPCHHQSLFLGSPIKENVRSLKKSFELKKISVYDY